FLARLLEPAEFGLIAMISVIIGMAKIFIDIGFGGAIVQRRRVHQAHYTSVFYFNICVGTVLCLLTMFSASSIADFYGNEQLVPLTQVMSLLFLINAFCSLQTSILRRKLQFHLLTKIAIVSAVIGGVIGVTLAVYGAGVWSLVAQTLSSGISYNILIWSVSKWTPTLLFSLKALKQLWGFSSRMFVSVLLDTLISKLDIIIIGKLTGPANLGLFQRARGLNRMVIHYSSGPLIPVLFSVLSKIQNDLHQFQNIIVKTFGIVNFVVFLLLGGLYLVSEELIVLLFTEKWLPSAEYLKILILSGFEIPIGAVLITVLSSRGNSKVFLRLEIYKRSLFVLNLALLFLISIKGYLYGLVLVSILAFMMDIIFASREIKLPMHVFIRPFASQMFICVMVVLCVLFLAQLVELSDGASFVLKGSLFTFFYVFFSWILKTSSYRFCYEQLVPIIKRKFSKNPSV
ncbi:MAG: lipopolysaccharide biosynthesis protein, partial [Thermodesulfobacteriota bacterium]|nr:lipopolysaccharide biosynthesis protein [Thermodesulfobacteriota bacterium]